MNYQYSSVISPSTYDNEGLSDYIDLRKNNHTYFEDRGAIRAQHDWNKFVGPVTQFKGTLAPEWSFMSVSVPECIPERLEVISYANEFAFLHDDATELVAENFGAAENDEMMNVFLQGASEKTTATSICESKGKRKMQSQLMLEMLKIDRECAVATMKAWAKFVEVGSSRQHGKVFDTLEDYLPYRIMDVGEMFWYGVVTFGMGLHIPDHEIETCRELMKPAWIAVGLANDIFSWPKERDAANTLGHSHVVNAIWVLMTEHQISAEEAELRCRRLSSEYVAQYVDTVKKIKHDESISCDLRKYVEAMQYSISGNIIWSKTCPRYNPTQNFNSQQLEWMSSGVPDLAEEPQDGTHLRDEPDGSEAGNQSSSPRNSISSASTPPVIGDAHAKSEGLLMAELLTQCDIPSLSTKVIEAPLDYVQSLPSKGARSLFIDALNNWLQVPEHDVKEVKRIIGVLHDASLMLDDVQDSSRLRRGCPSTHFVFGEAQTVNSAMFFVNQCLRDIHLLAGIPGLNLAFEKLATLFIGQGQDLHASRNLACPTIEEYIQTIDSKTGALFELTAQLMLLLKLPTIRSVDVCRLCKLIGRHFQIRDDYQNLASKEYASKKGFCEDLDGGKYTLPLIYLLQTYPHDHLVQNSLSTRLYQHELDREQKELLLGRIRSAKGLEHTRDALVMMQREISSELEKLTEAFGVINPDMESLLQLLSV